MDKLIYDEYVKSIADAESAIRIRADKTHKEVNQFYDEKPYFYHLDKVAKLTSRYLVYVVEKKEDILPVIFGAYFHDSIEDARLTYNDVMKIAKEYMSDDQALMAAEIVYALTNEKGKNRHERANAKYYAGIRETPYAPLVKAADRLSNYNYAKEHKSKMVKCYQKEMDSFIEAALTKDDGTFFVPQEMIDELKK